MNVLRLAVTFAALLVTAPLSAQNVPRPASPPCGAAAPTQPATPPARGQDSGTAPGGMGSTGWSGGTGGSHIGTSPSGPTPASPDPQPRTAEGIDPTRNAPPSSANPAC